MTPFETLRGEKAMKVVIIAAGDGGRLRRKNKNLIKPLIPILGVSLIERVILSCKEAGFNDFVVVVGFKKDELVSCLNRIAEKQNISLQIAENPQWKKGNGTSVLACERFAEEPFVLVMCDHIFDPEILQGLVQEKLSTDECVLAVDRRTNEIFDLEDATKVQYQGREIKAIGKELDSFNGIDTGIFLCTPAIFYALREANQQNKCPLSNGVRYLIRDKKMKMHDIGDRFWIDVDTGKSVKRAKRLLLTNLPKPQEDGFVSQYLNRAISLKVSSFLSYTKLTPNSITIISFVLALIGAYLFSFGNYLWTVVAGILVQLSSIMDGCDGEIARLKYLKSRFGGWLDTILDRYADTAIAIGITYAFWQRHPSPLVWIGGIGALVGFILSSYTTKEYRLSYSKDIPRSFINRLRKRDLRLFLIFVGALVARPFWSLLIVGAISHLSVVWNFTRIYFGKER